MGQPVKSSSQPGDWEELNNSLRGLGDEKHQDDG